MKFNNFQEVPFIQEVTRTWIKLVLQERRRENEKPNNVCMKVTLHAGHRAGKSLG